MESIYVMFGRVEGYEDILIFKKASKKEEAVEFFLEKVKDEHDWQGHEDIYLEFCVPLSFYEEGKVYKNENAHVFSF